MTELAIHDRIEAHLKSAKTCFECMRDLEPLGTATYVDLAEEFDSYVAELGRLSEALNELAKRKAKLE